MQTGLIVNKSLESSCFTAKRAQLKKFTYSEESIKATTMVVKRVLSSKNVGICISWFDEKLTIPRVFTDAPFANHVDLSDYVKYNFALKDKY